MTDTSAFVGLKLPMLGNWAGNGSLQETHKYKDASGQVVETRRTHDSNKVTRTSDWMLGHFRIFSQVPSSLSHAFNAK